MEGKQIDPRARQVGSRIRAERLRRGQTQEEFCAPLGISVSYLGSIERGTRPASRRVLELLHERLGISYTYLLEGRNSYPPAVLNSLAEPGGYHIRRDLSLMLGSCSPGEVSECYDLIQTYLNHVRASRGRISPTPPAEHR